MHVDTQLSYPTIMEMLLPLWPSLTPKSQTQMLNHAAATTPAKILVKQEQEKKETCLSQCLAKHHEFTRWCFHWMDCMVQKLVWLVNAWNFSTLKDGSDHMELCVTMSSLLYHWLLYELPACASVVPMTPQPGHPASTLMME